MINSKNSFLHRLMQNSIFENKKTKDIEQKILELETNQQQLELRLKSLEDSLQTLSDKLLRILK